MVLKLRHSTGQPLSLVSFPWGSLTLRRWGMQVGDRLRYGVVLLVLVCGFWLGGGWMPGAIADDYNRVFLVNKDFSGQDLTDDSFTKANLRGSNFSQSNLQGVSFFGANLEDSNLTGANLRYATLDSARFVNANLSNAVLESAFAFNTQFAGAIIDGADFTDVPLRDDMHDLLCQIATGTNPTTGRQTRDTLDCD